MKELYYSQGLELVLGHWKLFTESGFFDNDKKICDYSKEELDKFLYGEAEKIKIDEIGTMNYNL